MGLKPVPAIRLTFIQPEGSRQTVNPPAIRSLRGCYLLEPLPMGVNRRNGWLTITR